MMLASKVDKPSEILIKISNTTEYIESNIQNIEAPKMDVISFSMYEITYLQGSLKGVHKAIQVSTL